MELFKAFATLVLDTSQFEDKIRGASGTFKSLGSTITSGVGNIAKVMGTGLVAGASAGATAIGAITKSAIENFAEYEQLAGGAQKIFNQMDYSKIATDANNAYKELGLSANQYLAVINDVGATFAATMGDEAGYEAAKTGLKAISDYASGTGKNVDELSQKFTLITRSTSSYQSIADQFSGILPATSAGFLEQAQAAGILSDKYKQLTEVPIDEYQAAVSQMLEQGVKDLGLYDNTMDEAFSTLSGSLSMAKAAWSNLVTGMADENADFETLVGNFVDSVAAVGDNLLPTIDTALNGVADLIDQAFPAIMERVPAIISDFLPRVAESAVNIVKTLISCISDNQNSIFDTAIDVMNTLIDGFIELLPEIIVTGSMLLARLALGLVEAIPNLVRRIPEIVRAITNGFSAQSEDFKEIGRNIVQGLWNGIKSLGSWLGDQISGFFGGIVDDAKSLLGIHSPSRVFASIGENMALGLGEGWNDEFGNINSQIRDGMDFGTASIGFDRSSLGVSSAGIINSVASSGESALSGNMTVNLVMPDGTNFARYILPFLIDVAKSNGTPIINPT